MSKVTIYGKNIWEMTLEEAIKHCEEVAEYMENKEGYAFTDITYAEYASEHRQLAEWLMELKAWRRLGELYSMSCLPKSKLKS